MSFLACGFESVNFQAPCWIPKVSFDPPAVKMSSFVVLTASVTKELANEAPPLAKTLAQSSPATAGSSTALPSSSNGPLGRFPVPLPGGGPKMSEGMTALTVTEAVAPAASDALLAVNKSPVLIEVTSKVDASTPHDSRAASGS